jgi:TonB-linked SusC/RagA family outer membrane protein
MRMFLVIVKTFILLFTTTLFSFNSLNSFSQEKVKIKTDTLVSVDDVFTMIQKQTNYHFIYPENIFDELPKVKLKKGTIKVKDLLNNSISSKDFEIVLSTDNTIIVKKLSKVQQALVTGKVTDKYGQPIEAVTVIIKKTSKYAVTDAEGRYEIEISSPDDVLGFIFLGYVEEEIRVGNKKIINVTLEEKTNQLDEVILNAGYFKTTDKKKTSSIAKVRSKEIMEQPVADPIQTLQGRVSGLLISQTSGSVPGGAFSNVQIRGNNSISSGSDPLYVVDGIPYPSIPVDGRFANGSSGFRNRTSSNPLNTINPADIESVEVLKDADATSIYGSRGTNGVILITTKKGKAGKTKLDVDVYSGLGQMNQRLDLMSVDQYLQMRTDAFAAEGIEPNEMNAPDLFQWAPVNNNVQDEIIGGVAEIINTNTSLSWGNNKTNYILSTGFRREGNVNGIDDSAFQKFTGRMAVNHSMLNDKVNIGANILFSSTTNLYSTGASVLSLYTPPNAPLRNEDGSFYWLPEPSRYSNPLAALERISDNRNQNLTTNFSINAELAKGLNFKSNFGYSDIRSDVNVQTPERSSHPSTAAGQANSVFATAFDRTFIFEPQLEYKTNFGKLNLNGLLGTTYQYSTSDKLSIVGRGFSSDNLLGNIAAASDINVEANENFDYKYASLYTRVGLEWADKYILNGSYRRDGSSRFGPGRRVGDFMSVAGAWIFSEEDFLKESKILSFGKIRASYGTTGNDQIPNYGYLDSYQNNPNPYIGSPLIAVRIANPNFSWENNTKFDVGLELGFLNDRIRLTTNYFMNRSDDQLVGQPLPSQVGFTSFQANLPALVENTGLEVDFNASIIQKDNFNWNFSLNATLPRNELLEFPGLENSTFANSLTIGRPLDQIRGFIFNGIDPETGEPLFEDVDGNGVAGDLPNDVVYLGKTYPDMYGGIYNEFQYKRFNLNFLFQFRTGFDQRSAASRTVNGSLRNQLAQVFGNYWTSSGDESIYPRLSTELNSIEAGFYNGSSATVVETSFLRLSNVYFSYDLNNPNFERWGIQSAQVYFTGQNLFVITDFDGLDPETGNAGLPPLQILSMGIKFSL